MSTELDKTIKDLIKTVNFAAIKHRDQRRKNIEQTPYINHPLGVANILANEANITDLETLQAAILHDTVEDTDTTFEEIEQEFGKSIRDIVYEVSDDKSLPKEERKRLQIVHASTSSFKAKLVKLGDKLYNLRDLERIPPVEWTEEIVKEYFRWSKQVCQGLKGTNSVMEKCLDEIFQRNIVD